MTHINDCRVTEAESWNRCLAAVLRKPSSGFCIDNSYLSGIQASADQSICCNDSELNQSHLCFLKVVSDLTTRHHYCLRAREVSTLSSSWCHNHEDCFVNQSCLLPSFHEKFENETDSSKLIIVKRKDSDSILYVGRPDDIYFSVHISDYVPRTFIGPQFINSIDHLLRYIVSFSAGLAVLNVVPCLYMDEHIVSALSDLVFEGRVSVSVKMQILSAFIFVGSSLVILNLGFGMLALFL